MTLRKKMYFVFGAVLIAGLTLIKAVGDPAVPAPTLFGIDLYFLCLTLVYSAIIMSALEYFVFYRLDFINKRLSQIQSGCSGTCKHVVDTADDDEISDIAKGINKALDLCRSTTEELKKQSDLYMSLVEDAPLLVQRFLPDGTLTFVNKPFAKLHGKTVKELIGTNLFDFIEKTGGNLQMIKKSLDNLSPQKPSVTYLNDTPLLVNGFEPRWIMWVNRAIYDKYGKIIEYQSVGMDIYQQSGPSRKLSHLINNVLSLVYIIGKDGQIKYANNASEDTIGIKPTDLIGANFHDLISEEDQLLFKEALQKCIESKEILIKEFKVKTQNEESVILQMAIDVIMDDDQNVTNLVINARDITEVKDAHLKAIQAFETMNLILDRINTLETIIEKSPVIAFVWKNKNVVDYVSNNISLLGYDVEDFINGEHDFIDIVHPEDREKALNTLNPEISNHEVENQIEYRVVDKNGKVFKATDKTFMVEKDEGNITCYKGIVLTNINLLTEPYLNRTFDSNNRNLNDY